MHWNSTQFELAETDQKVSAMYALLHSVDLSEPWNKSYLIDLNGGDGWNLHHFSKHNNLLIYIGIVPFGVEISVA